MVVACFQAGGKWWPCRQLLKMLVKASMAIQGRCLKMGGRGPGAFLFFSRLMWASTSSGRISSVRMSSSRWGRLKRWGGGGCV
jgi:hypothetical protein